MITVTWRKDTSTLDRIEAQLPTRLRMTTYDVTQKVVDIIQSSWSGYSPPPSMPGETPHIETGELKDSIRIEQKRDVLGHYAAAWVILFDSPYAAALEFGYSPRNLAPRPFIRPAVEQAAGEVGEAFEHLLDFV